MMGDVVSAEKTFEFANYEVGFFPDNHKSRRWVLWEPTSNWKAEFATANELADFLNGQANQILKAINEINLFAENIQ